MITAPILADAAAVSAGDTAWVLASTALVMVMTVGLAFFYGGLVRPKNALNTMMMSVVALGAISVQRVLVGYSDRKSTRLNSSHGYISYAVFCLEKKKNTHS